MYSFPVRTHILKILKPTTNRVFRYYKSLGKDFGTLGYFEKEYCRDFERFMGTKGYAKAVNSGTAAIYIALSSLELPHNSSIVISAITDPGSVSPIVLMGHKIRIADNLKGKPFPSKETVIKACSKNTRCIIINHLAGIPVPEIKSIARWAKKNKIYLLEDCSQAHGATIGGHRVGTFGDVACFSTMFSKNHSAGASGGIVFTKKKSLYHKIILNTDRGKPSYLKNFDGKNPKTFILPALNFSQNELSCALGSQSLQALTRTNLKRKRFLAVLNKSMKSLGCKTSLYVDNLEGFAPFFGILQMTFPKKEVLLFKKLIKKKIPANVHYNYIVSEWPFVQKHLSTRNTKEATSFRDSSVNLLFNENFGSKEAFFIAKTIASAEKSLQLYE